MTLLQLRQKLEALLAGRLGTYRTKDGATFPAIFVGDPPSDWTATGLEVRINLDPEFRNMPLQNHEHHLVEEHRVRVVSHGGGSLTPVVRLVARNFTDCRITEIPPNEPLGILSQVLITIPT